MKLASLLAFLLACGTSSPDPHKLATCSGYTVNGAPATNMTCEVPCAMAGSDGGAPAGSGASCAASNPDAVPAFRSDTCMTTLEWMGLRGCCVVGGTVQGSPQPYEAYFYECQ